ncbi:MAG: hypothetical protein ACRDM1_02130 [Gaiellaceae bacterium]
MAGVFELAQVVIGLPGGEADQVLKPGEGRLSPSASDDRVEFRVDVHRPSRAALFDQDS